MAGLAGRNIPFSRVAFVSKVLPSFTCDAVTDLPFQGDDNNVKPKVLAWKRALESIVFLAFSFHRRYADGFLDSFPSTAALYYFSHSPQCTDMLSRRINLKRFAIESQ